MGGARTDVEPDCESCTDWLGDDRNRPAWPEGIDPDKQMPIETYKEVLGWYVNEDRWRVIYCDGDGVWFFAHTDNLADDPSVWIPMPGKPGGEG